MTPIIEQVRAFLAAAGSDIPSDGESLSSAEQTEFRALACTLHGARVEVFPTCYQFPELLPVSLQKILAGEVDEVETEVPAVEPVIQSEDLVIPAPDTLAEAVMEPVVEAPAEPESKPVPSEEAPAAEEPVADPVIEAPVVDAAVASVVVEDAVVANIEPSVDPAAEAA